jgi:hypothetical protein
VGHGASGHAVGHASRSRAVQHGHQETPGGGGPKDDETARPERVVAEPAGLVSADDLLDLVWRHAMPSDVLDVVYVPKHYNLHSPSYHGRMTELFRWGT